MWPSAGQVASLRAAKCSQSSGWNEYVSFISYQVSLFRYLMSPKTKAVTAKPLLGQPDSALGPEFMAAVLETSHMNTFFHLPGLWRPSYPPQSKSLSCTTSLGSWLARRMSLCPILTWVRKLLDMFPCTGIWLDFHLMGVDDKHYLSKSIIQH